MLFEDMFRSGMAFLAGFSSWNRWPGQEKTVSQMLENLFERVGPHFYHRRDIEFEAADRDRINRMVNDPELSRLGDFKVEASDSIDGRRLHFEDGWLGVRFSGTEPLLRIYAEAGSPERVSGLLDAAVEYLGV